MRALHGRRMRRGMVAVAVALLALAAPARADLKTKLPQATLLYIELAGADACRAACATTPFGRLLDDPGVRKLGTTLWAAGEKLLMAQAEAEGTGEVASAAKGVLLTLWNKGVAIDLIEVAVTEMGPSLSLVVATELGDDGPAFVEKFERLIANVPMPPPQTVEIEGRALKAVSPPTPFVPPIHYGLVDGVFLITVGADAPARVFAAMSGAAPNLAANVSLSGALAKTIRGGHPVGAMVYFDAATALAQGRQVFAAMSGAEDFPPPVASLIEELGLNSLRSVTLTCQVADGGYRQTVYAATEGEKKGLLRLLAQAPLADDDLVWAPKDATFAVVANFRVSELYDEVMRILTAIPEAPKAEIDAEIVQLEERMGLKLRDDIFAAFGDGYALFDAPSTGGFILTGLTLVVEVADEAAADKLVRRGAEALLNAIGEDVGASVRTLEGKPAPVHFIQFQGAPIPAAPAWAVHKGHLIVGIMPQTVAAAIERVASSNAREKSILANPDFVRGRKLLPAELVSVQYVDTAAGVAELYRLAVLGGLVGTSMARDHGIDIDAGMLPTYDAVTSGLFGDVSGVAATEEGLWMVRHGPLPVAVPTFSSGGTASTALALSVMLPSLSRARTLSKRVVSASNLKGIGTACLIYAYENQGKFPPDLQTLVARGDITEKSLIDPSSDGVLPSYAYIPRHTTKSDPRWVVAYEDYPGQSEEGANVLFADGHVEFIKPLGRVQELVEMTKDGMKSKE